MFNRIARDYFMHKYLLITVFFTLIAQGMQKPAAPNLPLTQANLELLNQANQGVTPMDTGSDTSSSASTRPVSLNSDPVEHNALLAQLAALDEHTWSTH